MSHKILSVTSPLLFYDCLFVFHKGYDESEYSTFSAANRKNYGQTVFFPCLIFAQLLPLSNRNTASSKTGETQKLL